MSTLAELAVEEILKSSNTTLNYLFPLLFESDLIFPSWIYHRVTMWWLKYNKNSIFDKMIGDFLEPPFWLPSFTLEPGSMVPTGSINLDYLLAQPYSCILYPESLVPIGFTNLDNF